MKRIVHHINRHVEHIRTKPHHVRKQVALAAAASITGIVGLVWVTYSAQTGVFAIQGSSFADAVKDTHSAFPQEDQDVVSGLAGAGASLPSNSDAPKLQVVDKTPPKPVKLEQTTIPF